MLTKFCLATILIAPLPLWSQVDGAAKESVTDSVGDTDSRMFTPPPVSGEAYPTGGTAEARSNYLSAGVSINSAYTDQAFVDSSGHPTGDVSYSIWPTIEFDRTSSRLNSALTYSPGFTFYQRGSSFNRADQSVGLGLRYRLSPHVTISLQDAFQRTSNIFNQPASVLTSPVFGSAQAPAVAVIVPNGDQLTNRASVGISYQYGPNGMVGVSGSFTNLHYPNPAEVPGLFDSSSEGGLAFYTHRLSRKHYVGVAYRFDRYLSDAVGAQTNIQTHTISAFYTVYFKPTLSLSVSGGPQRSDVTQFEVPASRTWSPAVATSLGWQGRRTGLAASYARIVSGGGGLTGAFHSTTVSVSASWQMARTWHVGIAGIYSNYANLEPLLLLTSPGGHSVSGSASIGHDLGQHLNVGAGYTRVHQTYDNVPVVSMAPDFNREFISISYHFSRAIGR